MQVLRDQSGVRGSSAWAMPGHRGRGVKKWPKRGHVVYGRSLINVWFGRFARVPGEQDRQPQMTLVNVLPTQNPTLNPSKYILEGFWFKINGYVAEFQAGRTFAKISSA